MPMEKILVGGGWRAATAKSSFHAANPATGETLEGEFPVSEWQDCDDALNAAAAAAIELRKISTEQLAVFLELFAKAIEDNSAALVSIAHAETGLAAVPRLRDNELPRTATQLRQGAAAAREGSGRRQSSTPRRIFARTSRPSDRLSFSVPTTFHMRLTASQAGTWPQPSLPATPSSQNPIRCIRAPANYSQSCRCGLE